MSRLRRLGGATERQMVDNGQALLLTVAEAAESGNITAQVETFLNLLASIARRLTDATPSADDHAAKERRCA